MVVVLRSRFRAIASAALLCSALAFGDASVSTGALTTQGLVAFLEARTTQELAVILNRAEGVFEQQPNYSGHQPIALVLHGDEAFAFVRDNYFDHREIVDLAARLDAFRVIDVQICETWMRENGISRDQLPPFVTTVPFGPAAEQKLLEQDFQHF